jgi:hypothetical protein
MVLLSVKEGNQSLALQTGTRHSRKADGVSNGSFLRSYIAASAFFLYDIRIHRIRQLSSVPLGP